MAAALARALANLRDPRLWAVAAKAVALTLALLAGGFGLGGWALGLGGDMVVSLPLVGGIDLSGGALALYVLVAIAASALLTPAVAGLFVGLMLEEVAAAVERRDYPGIAPARSAGFGAQLGAGVRLAGLALALNLLGLIVYLAAAPLAPFAFVAINGWLIGREYFETVALRRMGPVEARKARHARRWPALGVGAVVAAAMAVPVVNLVAPLAGVAAMVHLLHQRR